MAKAQANHSLVEIMQVDNAKLRHEIPPSFFAQAEQMRDGKIDETRRCFGLCERDVK